MQSDIQRVVAELKNSGVVVDLQSSEDGFVYWMEWPGEGTRYLLNTQQLLRLEALGKLTLRGVKELDAFEKATVEKDILAAREKLGSDGMQSLTAREIANTSTKTLSAFIALARSMPYSRDCIMLTRSSENSRV